jgi:hypothetical protein
MSTSLIVHQLNKKLLDNVSVAVSQSSDAININSYSLYAMQYDWSGYAGTTIVFLEISCNGTSWVELDKYNILTANDSRMLNIEKAGYAWIRVRLLDPGTSIGNFTATINGKVL